jgi:GH18 family chitinase
MRIWLALNLIFLCCFSIAKAQNKKVLGYVMGSSRYRPSPWDFGMSDLNTSMLTHAAYAFVNPGGDGFLIESETLEYRKFVFFAKRMNPDVVPMVAIGGWVFNSDSATNSIFPNIMADSDPRTNFISSIISFCRAYDAVDKQNFADFLQEFRVKIQEDAKSSGKTALFLSVAVSGSIPIAQNAYNLTVLNSAVDVVHVMTYEYAGSWAGVTGIHSNIVNAKAAVSWYTTSGISKNKILYGLAAYGRTFTVSSSNSAKVGLTANSPGNAGPYTKESGFLSYYEIEEKMKLQSSLQGYDSMQGGAILAYDENQWVGYDNSLTLYEKVSYIIQQDLAGAFLWSVDLDDFNNGYPLLRGVSSRLMEIKVMSDLADIPSEFASNSACLEFRINFLFFVFSSMAIHALFYRLF